MENKFITLNNIGEAYYNAGHFEQAESAFEKSLAILKQNGPSESEYPDAYEYCMKQIKRCRERIEQS